MRFLLIAALAIATLPAAAHAQTGTIRVGSGDAAMNAAISNARAGLPEFWRRFAAPALGENSFVIKFDLAPEATRTELIWGIVVSHANGVTVARLADTPRDTRFRMGQQVNVRDVDIVDWGYFRGAVMQGQFTTRVLLDAISPTEAAAIRKAYGW